MASPRKCACLHQGTMSEISVEFVVNTDDETFKVNCGIRPEHGEKISVGEITFDPENKAVSLSTRMLQKSSRVKLCERQHTA